MKRRRIIRYISDPVIIFVVAVVNLTPFLWSLLTSFKTERDIYVYPIKLIGFRPTLENYAYVLIGGRFLNSMLVSLFYGLVSIIACLMLASLASYAFARYENKGMSALFFAVIFGIPLANGSSSLIVSNFIIFSKLGIVNKIYTMPLIYTTYFLPMAILICLGGLRSIPIAVEEAAIIDGCSRRYVIFKLIPTLNKPALACAALFVFIGGWNEFIVPSVLIISPDLRAIQVATYYFMGFYGIQWGPLMTATICSLIPIYIIFTFLGRQLISGLTAGAVKG